MSASFINLEGNKEALNLAAPPTSTNTTTRGGAVLLSSASSASSSAPKEAPNDLPAPAKTTLALVAAKLARDTRGAAASRKKL